MRSLKDAHPLPHQSDCLAALDGNTYFSTMDLTSGFNNIPMAEESKKHTAFTTLMGLYEYTRMPHGLCNSPASSMRMMLSIFGDLNFSSLLCYLDDLLMVAPTEQEALERLEGAQTQQKLRSYPRCQKADLMEEDVCTPSIRRVQSFLNVMKSEQTPMLALTGSSNPLTGQMNVMQPCVT